LKIALDRKADEVETRSGNGEPIIQLRTPLTGYARKDGVEWVMDNGAYSNFDENKFSRMAQTAMFDENCHWLAMPDVVGDHEQTLNLFHEWKVRLCNHYIPCRPKFKKWAFVIQDGATIETIPWDEIKAVFLGGTTQFKLSSRAYMILLEAKAKGKWVHVGRVNTVGRISYFHDVADSIDGSGIAKYDHMLYRALLVIRTLSKSKATTLGEWIK
jgi:hypothetical protein